MSVLKLDSTGPEVITLQVRLVELGFSPGAADGQFGASTKTAVMMFQQSRHLVADGIVGPLTIAALAPPPPVPLPLPVPLPPLAPVATAFAGFDTSEYPGDHNMGVWKQRSPYGFVAYYLNAPCHHSASWMGHREALSDMGWNLLPVYVGQQVAGVSRCTNNTLTESRGLADGLDAGSKLASEGFAPASYVYLDIERTEAFPDGLADYISAWTSKVTDVGFGPGVYCHKHNATDVHAAVIAGLAGGAMLEPRFWIVGGDAAQFHLDTSKPSGVGVPFADLWQCPVSIKRTFGSLTINIDENLSTRPDPAAPPAT